MSELVTGEAVVLGVEPAKLPSRMLAKAVDLVLGYALYAVVILALAFAVSSLDDAAVAAVALTAMVLLIIGLPVLVETLSHGRSPGKLMMGLRVVRTDGGPVRFRHALVRGLLGFFEIQALFGIPAVVVSLFSPQGRRLGDVFAGTLVVRERIPGGRAQAMQPVDTQVAAWLGPRLAETDLSVVPEPLWLAVRQYLGRAGQLYPEVALAMAFRLASDVAARIGEAPPQDVHPAAYLAGVLAEWQRREWQRREWQRREWQRREWQRREWQRREWQRREWQRREWQRANPAAAGPIPLVPAPVPAPGAAAPAPALPPLPALPPVPAASPVPPAGTDVEPGFAPPA